MYLGPSPPWGPPPLTLTFSRSAALPMGKIYIESRANEWKSGGGGGGRSAAESFVGRIPSVGSIRCNNLLCHDYPRILPEPRASLHHPHTHLNTVWVRSGCGGQSLPYWIARAGIGGERDIPFLTAIRA